MKKYSNPFFAKKVVALIFHMVICKECTLVGSLTGPRPVIKEMIKLCVEKNIYPIVEEYDFDDLPKAFDKLENGKPHFRCVVNAKDYAEKHGLKK